MKKTIAILLALLMILGSFAGCGKKQEEEEAVEIIVFAAASMTETMTQIKEMYEAEHKNVTITYTFDSSGTLKTQIAEGADCDLFISASPKQMNALDASKEGGADFIDPETRVNLLENKVALVVPEGNPKNITSFDDVVNGLKEGTILFAMGNSDVPVGQYTQKIFAYYSLDEASVASNINYGSNVKAVTTAVYEATADCGVVYGTDAYSAGLTVVATATAEMCGQVIYPAAVLKNAPNAEAAKAFLAYLQGEAAGQVFEAVGFSPIAK